MRYLNFNHLALQYMENRINIEVPDKLPFPEAVCWDLGDVRVLDPDEMLNRYERGWENRDVLADLTGSEKIFVVKLAREKGSWLQLDV